MKTTTVDGMASCVIEMVNEYAALVPAELAEAQKTVAKATVKKLKSTSPKKTGEYAKGWKSKTTVTRTGAETEIYNSEKPGLAHLLEFGHPVTDKSGKIVGRSRPFPHIAPAEQEAARMLEEEIKRRLESGT